jgi:hypothetical protein
MKKNGNNYFSLFSFFVSAVFSVPLWLILFSLQAEFVQRQDHFFPEQ